MYNHHEDHRCAFASLLVAQPPAAFIGATSKASSETALFGLPPKAGDNKDDMHSKTCRNKQGFQACWKEIDAIEYTDVWSTCTLSNNVSMLWRLLSCRRTSCLLVRGAPAGVLCRGRGTRTNTKRDLHPSRVRTHPWSCPHHGVRPQDGWWTLSRSVSMLISAIWGRNAHGSLPRLL